MTFPEPIAKVLSSLSQPRDDPPNVIHVTEISYCRTKNLLSKWLTPKYPQIRRRVSLPILYGNVWHRIASGVMAGEKAIDFSKPVGYPERKIRWFSAGENEGIFITGQADWLEQDDSTIGELKTTQSMGWIKRQGLGEQYEFQGIMYCWLYQVRKVHWYVTDFRTEVIEFEEEYSYEDIARVSDWARVRARELYYARIHKKLIQQDVDFTEKENGWQCVPKYCAFTKYCWPEFPFHQKSKLGRRFSKDDVQALLDPDDMAVELYDMGIHID